MVTVEGRQDDLFQFGATVIHPNVVRSVLLERPEIVEYQVRQTPTGLDVAAVTAGPLDTADLADRLQRALARAGRPASEVTVKTVAALERNPQTGKAKRFIALAGT